MRTRRLFLVRHGETQGESSIRYHGRTDTPLSPHGRDQMRLAAARLRGEVIDTWLASSLQRSWMGAQIASDGAWVRIESGFREVDFGAWEGLTADEIRARDPERFERWQSGTPATGFDYPAGEAAAAFQSRVAAATDRLLATAGPTAACVLHKGVIRQILGRLGLDTLDRARPELGEILLVARAGDAWRKL